MATLPPDHPIVGAAERALAHSRRYGDRLPTKVRVPVVTREMAITPDGAADPMNDTMTRHDIELDTVRVAITDLYAYQTHRQIDVMRRAAGEADRHAEAGGHALLSPFPYQAQRDPMRAVTHYDYYTTATDAIAVAFPFQQQQNAMATLTNATITWDSTAFNAQLTNITAAFNDMAGPIYTAGTAMGTLGQAIGTNTFTYTTGTTTNYWYPAQAVDWGTGGIGIAGGTGYIGGTYPNWQPPTPEETAKLEVIRQTAERLLLSHLREHQLKSWLKDKFFDVVSASGRRYRIKNYQSGNVFLLDAAGKEIRKYCAYAKDPGGALPLGDYLFTQMLTLQFNEREFLAKANTWDMLKAGAFVGQGVDRDMADVPLVMAA